MADPNATIGGIIAKHAPAGWQKAWVSAKADTGYVGELTADYIDAGGAETWFDIADSGDVFALSTALLELRESTRQDGQPAFSRCTFTLTPDGAFKLDVGYPD